MRIKSSERKPFIKALQKLRPDLKKTVSELESQLQILKDDIIDLLGRLPQTDISPESKSGLGNGEPSTMKDDKASPNVPGAIQCLT